MFSRIRIFSLAALSLALAAGAARAERIDGRVISANAGNGTLVVERANPVTGVPERIQVLLDEDTGIRGARSLENIDTGDQVRLDVANRKGILSASSVHVLDQQPSVSVLSGNANPRIPASAGIDTKAGIAGGSA